MSYTPMTYTSNFSIGVWFPIDYRANVAQEVENLIESIVSLYSMGSGSTQHGSTRHRLARPGSTGHRAPHRAPAAPGSKHTY